MLDHPDVPLFVATDELTVFYPRLRVSLFIPHLGSLVGYLHFVYLDQRGCATLSEHADYVIALPMTRMSLFKLVKFMHHSVPA